MEVEPANLAEAPQHLTVEEMQEDVVLSVAVVVVVVQELFNQKWYSRKKFSKRKSNKTYR